MKALIKSSVCLALGWLASGAGAQEVSIKWQSAAPKNPIPAPVTKSDTGVRPISLSQPQPLESGPGSFAPIVRMQAADDKDKTVQPVPKLEVIGPEVKPLKKMPDKDGFTPPPPSPGPVSGSLGIRCEDSCCTDGPAWCGRGWWGHGWFSRACCNTDGCSDRPRIWASAEYLMWWQRSQAVPPLVTSSPAGTPIINSGVLGLNSTTVLYDSVPDSTRSGGRFTIGTWCPHFCNLGIEGSFFSLGRQTHTSIFGSSGDPQFDRPIFNAITGKQASEQVSNNNLMGSAAVYNYSQLWGADINVRRRWHCGDHYYIDWLAGYRHLNLSEGIEVTENLQIIDPVTRAPGGQFIVRDSFATRNQFNGMQIGFDSECRFWSRCFVGLNAKLALGSVHQSVEINGSTTFNNFPAPFGGTFPGGLLALPGTNIGRYTQNRFGVLPEVGLKIGMDLNDHWRVFIGYDFLYLNNVVRPGDQIDLRVNPNFQPSAAGPGSGIGPRVPAVLFRTSDYWAQGLNFGLVYRY